MESCDLSCPNLESEEAIEAQNYGCLPCYFDIQEMLKNKRVWMCHSNIQKPCVATGLEKVPDGYTPTTTL